MSGRIDSEVSAQAWLTDVFGADDVAMERLARLVALLDIENRVQNLVSRGSQQFVWARHIVDSAQLLLVSRGTAAANVGRWLDLGTGAGFPGLVIAVLQPDRPVTLVDSRRLRADWLNRAVAALELKSVNVVAARVEDLPARTFAVISARAFAPLPRLLNVSARFSTPQTLWLLPKGANARHELAELGEEWSHTFHVEQSLTDSAAGVLVGHVLTTPHDKGARP